MTQDAAPEHPSGAPTPTPAAQALGRDFHIHLGAVSFNALAGGILFAGVPLVAATLTQSPREILVISAAATLPALLGVVAGLVVDRTDRRRLRLAMFGVRAGLLFGLLAVALTGSLSIWVIAGLMFLYALSGVFIASANTAMVPQVAPRSQLAAANSRIQGAMFVLEDVIGAPVASLLVLAGAVWLFGVPSLFVLLALLVLWMGLRGRSFRPAPRGIGSRPHRWRSLHGAGRHQGGHALHSGAQSAASGVRDVHGSQFRLRRLHGGLRAVDGGA